MKNIIITGASGMIGVALIKNLMPKSGRIAAIVRPGSERNKYIPAAGNVELIECGLENMDKLPSLLTGKFDAFFHLGWAHIDREGRNDPQKQDKNINYTASAAEAAAKFGCGVFIGAGSQAEYGRYDVPIKENFELKPETAYGRAKIRACDESRKICAGHGLKHVWPRIFSVYGPNDNPDTMIAYCINTLLKGNKPLLTKCEQIWDYLYCSDAAAALALAAEKGRDKSAYNVGGGKAAVLREFVLKIRDIINPELETGIGEREYAPGQVMHLCADITATGNDTGFKPSVVFEEGIKKTIQWHKENLS